MLILFGQPPIIYSNYFVGGFAMFEYMTVQEAAKKWGLSERRIQKLCADNRIDGVVHLSRVWLIPKDAEKPADGRTSTRGKHNL